MIFIFLLQNYHSVIRQTGAPAELVPMERGQQQVVNRDVQQIRVRMMTAIVALVYFFVYSFMWNGHEAMYIQK